MAKESKKNILHTKISFDRFSTKDKATFARNMGMMLKAGLTITEALDVIIERKTGFVRKMFIVIQSALSAGNKISEAFDRYPKTFDKFFINALQTGEASGNLEENFNNLADHYESAHELKKKIRGAMTYPAIVLVLSVVMGMGLAIFVLPKITPIFSGLNIELPWTTRMLIKIADIMESHGWIIFLAVISITTSAVLLLRTRFMRPFTHGFYLKFPIVKSISQHKNISQVSHTLGTLIKSGMSMDEALETTSSSVDNFYYEASLKNIGLAVNQGRSLSDAFNKFPQLYSTLMVSLIRVGEKSGNLEESFANIGDVYNREVDDATKTLSTVLEPVLLIIIGLVVGLLAISIITPIYTITGNVYR